MPKPTLDERKKWLQLCREGVRYAKEEAEDYLWRGFPHAKEAARFIVKEAQNRLRVARLNYERALKKKTKDA